MAHDKKKPTVLSQNCAEAKDAQLRRQLASSESETIG